MTQRRHRAEDEEAEKERGERWLLTYSDMITLLLALFIIMYAMSTVNMEKFRQMSESLGAALNNPAHKEQVHPGGGPNASNTTSAGSIAEEPLQVKDTQDIYDYLKLYIEDNGLEGSIDIQKTETSVILRLKDTVLFQPDTAVFMGESRKVLENLGKVISAIYNQVDHITITGNTADVGRRDQNSQLDAWQLSVDRAVQVLNSMSAGGLPEDKFSIEGNSHYRPVADNSTEEGRSKNRRVEISIFKSNYGKTPE